MFRKMLVCTDLSPASNALVQCVEELKGVGLEKVVLAHAIPYADAPLPQEAQQTLERQRKILRDQGVAMEVDLPTGPNAAALAEAAEIHDVSAILVGSHGKGVLQEATLGSVSADLLHRARRPVLLARMAVLQEGKGQAVCGRLFARVLFPTDFSETAERALRYVGVIGKETGADITLLHVMSHESNDAAHFRRDQEAAHYLLDAKKKRLERSGALNVSLALATGHPDEQIAERAREGGYTLIVMGFTGKGVVQELLIGSVAHAMARRAAVPVLFIPRPD